ncbi:DNA-binding protein [Novosphingobium flavum]|uniref:DNA-binding protein n=1 Tax=Novosphingobium flavum TaxID=1778672 RepID=A0A7X1KMF5_9SPHN|nr:DNA-binding protein [Novosphingobium flavum]MBC2666581.1 DNA-binding protein [Novosphingobium flavum]
MPARRVNPYRVKLHRSYSVPELADCLGVHKNTVRHWQRDGLTAIDGIRPALFAGSATRTFLLTRQTSRKRPCPPGTIYCFKCRAPQPPALGMVEFIPGIATTGNLMALCDACGTPMHRRANAAKIGTIMPGLAVQIRQAPPRLLERACPSLNCDKPKD